MFSLVTHCFSMLVFAGPPGMPGGPAKTSIEKQCVTKENIHKTLAYLSGRDSAEEKETSNCKTTVLKSTATVMESRVVCPSTNGPNGSPYETARHAGGPGED